jgi:hypothetical protein
VLLLQKKHYLALGVRRSHERVVQIDSSGQYIYWTDPKVVVGGAADGQEDGVTNKIALVDILSVNYGVFI